MAPTDVSPSAASQDTYADWDETASGRRPGDDPFLPEEGLFWWLPRAALLLILLLGLGYLTLSSVNRGKYQLVLDGDGNAVLERGRFSTSGWNSFVPDGALEAWAPVPWPQQSVEAPLEGALVDLADTYLGFLRFQATKHLEDDVVLDVLAVQEEKLEDWYRTRWDAASVPQPGDVKAQRAARDHAREEVAAALAAAAEARLQEQLQAKLQAEVEEQARIEEELRESSMDRARSYAVRRRLLLREAEVLLEGLPQDGGPEQGRDREAVERFIDSMNTPVDFP